MQSDFFLARHSFKSEITTACHSLFTAPPTDWDAYINEFDIPQTVPSVSVKQSDRRWEFVSTYQKAVRRGDLKTALMIVGAFASIPDNLNHLWRRLAVTVAEDVGAVDPSFMGFVLLVCQCYSKLTMATTVQIQALARLTRLMVAQPHRSRTLCTLSILQEYSQSHDAMSDYTNSVLTHQETVKSKTLDSYLRGKKTATEGISPMVLKPYSLQSREDKYPVTDYTVSPRRVFGIPEYAMDMHTRTGLMALRVLSKKPDVANFFKHNPVSNKVDCLGYSLFYSEGGLLASEQYDPLLFEEELRVGEILKGLPSGGFSALSTIILPLLKDGTLCEIREWSAKKQGYGQ